MDCEDIEFLFVEYCDLLYFEGYTQQTKAENPEKYAAELQQFKDAHVVFPLVLNFD